MRTARRAQAPVWAELIVAVGVIALVITMLVPVMSMAGDQGDRIVNGTEYEDAAQRGQGFGIDTFAATPVIALGVLFVFGVVSAVVSSRL